MHMFNNGLVCTVSVGGKILRENEGQVSLPFGSEFSLRFKNTRTEKAVAAIKIDGVDPMNGSRLIIPGLGEAELQGFMSADGSAAKAAFRFIEKTAAIADHRGNIISDGLIEVVFQFEEPIPEIVRRNVLIQEDVIYPPDSPWKPNYPKLKRYNLGGLNYMSNGPGTQAFTCANLPEASLNNSATADGITVQGSDIHQAFRTGYTRRLAAKQYALSIKLMGHSPTGKKISIPTLTRKRVKCSTCGTSASSGAKFCQKCSTRLTPV